MEPALLGTCSSASCPCCGTGLPAVMYPWNFDTLCRRVHPSRHGRNSGHQIQFAHVAVSMVTPAGLFSTSSAFQLVLQFTIYLSLQVSPLEPAILEDSGHMLNGSIDACGCFAPTPFSGQKEYLLRPHGYRRTYPSTLPSLSSWC